MNKYCEGKVKRTREKGIIVTGKPSVYKPWKHYAARNVRPRAFCIMSLRVTVTGKVKPRRSRSESESDKGAESVAVDPKGR